MQVFLRKFLKKFLKNFIKMSFSLLKSKVCVSQKIFVFLYFLGSVDAQHAF